MTASTVPSQSGRHPRVCRTWRPQEHGDTFTHEAVLIEEQARIGDPS